MGVWEVIVWWSKRSKRIGGQSVDLKLTPQTSACQICLVRSFTLPQMTIFKKCLKIKKKKVLVTFGYKEVPSSRMMGSCFYPFSNQPMARIFLVSVPERETKTTNGKEIFQSGGIRCKRKWSSGRTYLRRRIIRLRRIMRHDKYGN